MDRTLPKFAAVVLGLACLASVASAQSNVVNGRNVKLNSLNTISWQNRTGTFPNGTNALAESTTSCNNGTVTIPWSQPMAVNHPFISFIVARESNGKFEQISDRSYVKHGFFATNVNDCGTCQNPGTSSLLGINCSDTYGVTNNGDNFYLGPADEIDPWLGTWTAVCSHFDQGEPAVAPPFNCDGQRSFTMSQANNLGPIGHRVTVRDADFNVAGANFYYQAMYITQGEIETNRGDNCGWRKMTATWSAGQNKWNLSSTTSMQFGSILNAWTGATVASNTNGNSDGRFFVAVKVTGPVNGLFHYEYAVHDRDNVRGASTFRIPVCASAIVSNPGFKDVDVDGTNDWVFTRTPTEIQFSHPSHFLLWNTIYSFSFDSTAGPASGTLVLDQAKPGAGAAVVSIANSAPLGDFNVYLGDGCGVPSAPVLAASGAPPQATLPNASFALQISNVSPGSQNLLWASALDGTLVAAAGCSFYMDVNGLFLQLPLTADGTGKIALPLAIPADPMLEGVHVNFQDIEVQANGALFHQYDLSNGLRVRIGNLTPGCP